METEYSFLKYNKGQRFQIFWLFKFSNKLHLVEFQAKKLLLFRTQ